MIKTWAFDLEVLPNFLSITFINLQDYLVKCACNDEKGKPIPLTRKFTVKEIKEKLESVECKILYITDTDDSQLLEMVSWFNRMNAHYEPRKDKDGNDYEEPVRTDLYSFNGNRYDNLMVSAFLMSYNRFDNTRLLLKHLHDISKEIIKSQNEDNYYNRNNYIDLLSKNKLPYASVDVMTVFALNKASVMVDKETNERKPIPKSLKQTSINLQWHELLEWELPPISDIDRHLYSKNIYGNLSNEELTKHIDKWDRFMVDEYLKPMLHYNKNDVFIVCEMVRQNINEIRLRYSISSSYKVNVLSSSRSNIADTLFVKFYSQFSGLHKNQFKDLKTERTRLSFKKIIFDVVKFETVELKSFLEDIRTISIYRTTKDEFSRNISFYGTEYTIATGGLHSKDIPRVLRSTDKYTYIHYDIGSFYPSLMDSFKIYPAHLNKAAFNKLIHWLKETRLTAKHAIEEVVKGVPNKVLADVLKIVINAIYGKLGFEKGFLYDRLAQMQVTINGQLMIIMLIEQLELNCIHVVSANTDGIVVKLFNDKVETFNNITKKWEAMTNMTADSEKYMAYINRDINNYIIKELNGNISYKGAFDPEMYRNDLKKGYDMPVTSEAASKYFLDNIPIMDTIMANTNILDFCKTQNVGRRYELQYTTVKNGVICNEVIQRNTRFYISTDGGILEKVDPITKERSRLAAGYRCNILNSLDDKDISLRNIDYKYYYEEAFKLVNPIMLGISNQGKGRTRARKYSGLYNPLFDNEEFGLDN
jgi:hypothetical protein